MGPKPRKTLIAVRCVTRGGEGGEDSPAPFQKLEKSALILEKNALIVSILGLISHFKCGFKSFQEKKKAYLADYVLKFGTEIYILLNTQKLRFFTYFDRQSCSMLPWESKFDAKFLFMVLIESISGRCTHSVQPRVIWV